MQKIKATVLGPLCLLMTTTLVSWGQSATAIPKLDLNRFTGAWYEIARYPSKHEKTCVRDAFTQIALADKPSKFQLVNACRTKSGEMDAWNANGKLEDKNGDGRLKISYLWPFYTKFWVLEIDPDYKWALIGSPNHKNLWIFSRTPTLTPEVLSTIEAQAIAEGFPASKLALTPQNSRRPAPVP